MVHSFCWSRHVYFCSVFLHKRKWTFPLILSYIGWSYGKGNHIILTCFSSSVLTASFFALSSQVPSKKLSSVARSSSMSTISSRNFLLFDLKACRSLSWKAVTASRYIWFASFDNDCLVKSTKSYLLIKFNGQWFFNINSLSSSN